MSFAGRLARGLAAGLGNYLVQEGFARLDDERRARILKDREQAVPVTVSNGDFDGMFDPDAIRIEAEEAIRLGADPDKVHARLKLLSRRG